ncbi:phosphogluconate dehydratase [Succinivibrio dextrinosolvens]|uniref:Phosphogluconate dehydratase n=1 Tax=Succinivibrio dextrinosolvens TaxID=83771 RepID=A0A662Z8W4_9GAMM|nr:phosphogluconate dehydratase [Succinivibrio dextrinosolvens]SFJ86560.1 6-phosphogluconate dehydratase [Succinivibrio dextrinosolvens]
MMNKVVEEVTRRIEKRSELTRKTYLEMIDSQAKVLRDRDRLTCSNIAHAAAAATAETKENLITGKGPNLGIVSAYNDMVSAHCPYRDYPSKIAASALEAGASSQVAGMVPAMCDGITQGQPGMDISLFSRDLIAQGVAVALSHNIFDGILLLGICDKIAPGLLMGAASFAHLPVAFIPSGPMGTGISNKEKSEVRQDYAAGKIDKVALQRMECKCYHSKGTCTFYGTANTNQLVLEAMGLMLPGSAFVPPDTPLREKLTDYAVKQMVKNTRQGEHFKPLFKTLTAKNLVNGLVALLASGGSTNHTLHMPAIARSAGYILTWQDISDLSEVVPLLVQVYPNAVYDINALQNAGGVPVLLKALSKRGLLHEDVETVFGTFTDQLKTPVIEGDELEFVDCGESKDPNVIISDTGCFREQGGLKVLHGNLGDSVIKISAVSKEHQHVKAPARVFNSQYEVQAAYKEGKLNQDAVIVVRYAGPAASGMPELHTLMPVLGNLQKAGYHVALLTDGRLSGASGGIPSALHLSPEAAKGGLISLLKDGDLIDFDAEKGEINCLTSLENRRAVTPDLESEEQTYGRMLFRVCRENVSPADQGASFIFKEVYVRD